MALRIPLNVGRVDRRSSFQKQMRRIVRNFKHVTDAIENDVMPEALRYAVMPIVERSQYYVPVDTGALKASQYVFIGKLPNKPRISVGYARGNQVPKGYEDKRENLDYAIKVHELSHYYHKPPTQYKFLEQAFNERAEQILPRVAEYTRSHGVGK